MSNKSPPHPGRTAAQRRALDAIGCGDNCPPMHRSTRKALLEAGLIRQLSDKVIGRDAMGRISIPQFEMPLHIHMAWCSSVSEGITDEDLDAACGATTQTEGGKP